VDEMRPDMRQTRRETPGDTRAGVPASALVIGGGGGI
jgi:hypothetical protein